MLYDKISNYIKKNNLIAADATVYAAVSGGADSVCLLEVLKKLEKDLGFTLKCAHFNHNLRGAQSDADEKYVMELCGKLDIPFFRGEADVKAMAHGKSVEDAARIARYAFFEQLTNGKNAVVATAHTLNDNVETFFINLLRGSSSRGLCAIPVRRQNIIRPMLEVSRQEIVAHLEELGLPYVTDRTNLDTSYLRNFIRLEILPMLNSRSEINPYVTVSRAISNLKLENEALDEIADQHTDCSGESLSRLPDAVLWRVLTRKTEQEFGFILDSTHFNAVKSILHKPNARIQIRGDIFAVTENGILKFNKIESDKIGKIKLEIGNNIVLNRQVLIKKAKEIYNDLTNTLVDCDKIGIDLFVDSRHDGDIFYCRHRSCTSSLKKLLINDKIPRIKRDNLILIRDNLGNVVFVEGYGVDARFAADKNSENIISIEII